MKNNHDSSAHGGRSDPTLCRHANGRRMVGDLTQQYHVCHVNDVPNTAKTTVCVLHMVRNRHTKMASFYGTTDFIYQEQGNVRREKRYRKP